MSQQDAGRGRGVDAQAAAESASASAGQVVLAAGEKAVLDLLVAGKTAKTVTQLCVGSGLKRNEILASLEGLRTKGLVTRFNTLVESYAARFPGVEV